MPPPDSPVRLQFGLRGWAAVAAGLAILAAIVLLTIGLFVFLLPVLLLAPILYWLLPKPKITRVNNPAPDQARDGATIIDGEFRVVDAAKDNSGPPALEP